MYMYVYIVMEMALNGTTKYRISSYPPLNACLARLCGKRDAMCVSGGENDCFYVHTVVKQGLDLLLPIPDEAPPSRLRGVAWRGGDVKERSFLSAVAERGVCRSERTKRGKRKVQGSVLECVEIVAKRSEQRKR